MLWNYRVLVVAGVLWMLPLGPASADCPDSSESCYKGSELVGTVKVGSCWVWMPPHCGSCGDEGLRAEAVTRCNRKYKECEGECKTQAGVYPYPISNPGLR